MKKKEQTHTFFYTLASSKMTLQNSMLSLEYSGFFSVCHFPALGYIGPDLPVKNANPILKGHTGNEVTSLPLFPQLS